MRAIRVLSAAVGLVLGVALGIRATCARADDLIKWQPSYDAAQQVAAQTNRLILIHFWAPWCAPCMRLEQQVFNQPEVARALDANFVPVKINFDESRAFAQRYGVSMLPSDVIVAPNGQLISQILSPSTPHQYIAQTRRVADGYRQLQAGPTVQFQAPGQAPAATMQALSGPIGNAGPPSSPYVTSQSPPIANAAAVPPAADRYAARGPSRGSMPGNQQVPVESSSIPMRSDGVAAQTPPADYQGPPPQNTSPPAMPGNPGPAGGNPALAANATAMPLPPGSPPLALDGYCPVRLIDRRELVRGDVRFGVYHRGRTYLFGDPDAQRRFLASPDAYSPVMSGDDPVLAIDRGQNTPGRREHGVFFENRIYLFSSEATLEEFRRNPRRYAAEVLQARR